MAYDLERSVKYIEDYIFFIDEFKDGSGNPINRKIWNEKKRISSEYHTVLFSYIYSENNDLEVRQSFGNLENITEFITFKRIHDNSIPKKKDEFSVQKDRNGVARGILFYETLNCMVEYDYSAKGRCVISSDVLCSSYNSNGDVIGTFEQMIRENREILDNLINKDVLGTQIIEISSNELVAEDGLYTKTIPHVLKSKNVTCTIRNSKGSLVASANNIINESTVKIYVYNKEDLKVKIDRIGVS